VAKNASLRARRSAVTWGNAAPHSAEPLIPDKDEVPGSRPELRAAPDDHWRSGAVAKGSGPTARPAGGPPRLQAGQQRTAPTLPGGRAHGTAPTKQVSLGSSLRLPDQGGRYRLVSSGPVARFEDDHGRLGRPSAGIGVELRIDRDPALPWPITLLPRRRACPHRARMLACQSDDGVWVRLEVEPPRGMALVPAVHRERDQVGAVFEVADDDAALSPGLAPDGREAQRPQPRLLDVVHRNRPPLSR
jgi:hypothetical protein